MRQSRKKTWALERIDELDGDGWAPKGGLLNIADEGGASSEGKAATDAQAKLAAAAAKAALAAEAKVAAESKNGKGKNGKGQMKRILQGAASGKDTGEEHIVNSL